MFKAMTWPDTSKSGNRKIEGLEYYPSDMSSMTWFPKPFLSFIKYSLPVQLIEFSS